MLEVLGYFVCLLPVFIILFLAVYFQVFIYQYFHPWICEKGLEGYRYHTPFTWYSNWLFTIVAYRCKVHNKYFIKRWLVFALLDSILFFGVISVISLTANPMCCAAGVILLIAVHLYLMKWLESVLSEKYAAIIAEENEEYDDS